MRREAIRLAALLALAPAAPARAGAPCALAVTVEPARLEATSPRAAQVRVAGAAGSAPRLGASAGVVQAEPGGGGAAWQAPPAGVPRVAVLGAIAEDGACGYAAVPLDGLGDAEVRTRPGAVVEVRIADRTFGPARADPSGLALVPVEVPPGVDAVFHGARRIPLPLPPVARAALFLAAEEAPADREVLVAGLLVVVQPGGAPAAGPPPALAASAGAVAPPEPAGPGAWRLRWRLPAGPAAEAVLTAQRPGEPAVRVSLRRLAGPPATARLTLAPDSATAGQAAPVIATVALADAAGNPADGALAAEVEAGVVEPAERIGPGAYRLRWTAPGPLQGRRAARLVVRSGAASAAASLALAPGEPARLALSPAAPLVIADGAEEAEVVASVADAHGNPVDAPPAVRTAGLGTLGPPRQAGPGRFAMAYRPRPAVAPADDELVVALPPLTARAHPRLRPPLPPLTLAALAGLALGGGRSGVQAGAQVGAWRWLGTQEAGLTGSAALLRLRREGTATAGAAEVPFTGELRVLSLLASAGWRRTAGARLSVRLEAGAGAARVESLVAAGGGPLLPEAAWVAAAGGAAAAGWRLGPGRLVTELRLTWLADPALASLRGAPAPLALSLGYELDAP